MGNKTKEWIKNQPCYYDDVAESYCDRWATTILEGKYLCRKCAGFKKRHKFLTIFWFAPPLALWTLLFFGLFYRWPWYVNVPIILFAIAFSITIIRESVSFEHPGDLDEWSGFCCKHCSKKFLDKSAGLFIKHLKKEHFEEWKDIENQLQQIPNNKQVIKIELPYILREHKKDG